jgi:hypothetical protein
MAVRRAVVAVPEMATAAMAPGTPIIMATTALTAAEAEAEVSALRAATTSDPQAMAATERPDG